MNDLRKAAEMALDALMQRGEHHPKVYQAVEALRQALDDKPPVKTYAGGKPNYCTPEETPEVTGEVPCKTDPRAPHGFDRNASHAADRYVCECEGWEPVDAVNMTQDRVDKTAKGEHEPVAWYGIDDYGKKYLGWDKHDLHDEGFAWTVPLYLAPPKRDSSSWVGLTDEERHNIREWQEIQKELGPVWAPMMLYLYLAIERALKEKNT